jgi:hypothetical protein
MEKKILLYDGKVYPRLEDDPEYVGETRQVIEAYTAELAEPRDPKTEPEHEKLRRGAAYFSDEPWPEPQLERQPSRRIAANPAAQVPKDGERRSNKLLWSAVTVGVVAISALSIAETVYGDSEGAKRLEAQSWALEDGSALTRLGVCAAELQMQAQYEAYSQQRSSRSELVLPAISYSNAALRAETIAAPCVPADPNATVIAPNGLTVTAHSLTTFDVTSVCKDIFMLQRQGLTDPIQKEQYNLSVQLGTETQTRCP